ncbi:type II secretion system F family protein [Tomitella biformata]|uniref:type II secretion system F family protein n=1 Tax=Tomitella biformata TaxID=630403 RepID=UPI000463C6A8|nr:type II secretion system F family protein [Tomitella biformata]
MTAGLGFAALALAGALLAWPGGAARQRLRADPARGIRTVRRRGQAGGVLAVLAVLAGAFWVGLAGIVAAAMVVGTLAFRRHARILDARGEEGSAALVEALDVLVSQLRVGVHPGMACAFAAVECGGSPVGPVLERAAAQAALGGSIAEALDSDVADFPDLPRVAGVWALAERHGIAMGEMLDVVRRDLLERQGFRRRVSAGLAGPRATATVLALLPVVGVGLGQLMGAAPLGVLLGGGLGGVLLVVGVLLDCGGLLWAERIARVGVR